MDKTPKTREGAPPFSAFYYRDFRLFWGGQVISFSGTWMHSTAQGWLVYSLTKSPFYMGLVAAASSLPILMLSLVGGAVADRFRKRNLLMVTQGLSMLPAVMIGVLTSLGVITVWHVMALVFVLGTVNAFDVPARQSFFVEMVEKGHLLNAIALNSAAFSAARTIGPVIAGMTITYVGLPACFYINAVSFLPVILALSMMKAKGEARLAGEGILREISEGVRFIRREPGVLMPMLLVATFSTFGIPFITLLPVFAEEVLGVGPKGLGFLAGATGIGSFTAAMSLAFKGEVKGKGRLIGVSSITFPAALFLFSISEHYYLSLLCLVLVGWAVVSFLALANSIVQMSTPDGLRGRVMSVHTLVFLGMSPVGNTIMGSVAESVGTANAVSLASVVCLAASVTILRRMAREK